MLQFKTIDTLGKVLGYGYGRSNNTNGVNVASIKGTIAGNELHVSYTTIFTYDKQRKDLLEHQLRMLKEESSKMINDFVTKTKSEFKSLSSNTLKLNELSRSDSIEMTSYNSMNTKATAYFRMIAKYEIS
jgi:hypothetical protein